MDNPPEVLSTSAIYQASNTKKKKIFGDLKPKEETTLSGKAKNPLNYASSQDAQPKFIHSHTTNQTCLLFPLNAGSIDSRCSNKEDQEIFISLYLNFSNYSFNHENHRKAFIIRNIISKETLKNNKVVSRYFDFIKEVTWIVYRNIYDSKINILGMDVSDFSEYVPGKDDAFTLGYDLLNISTIRTVVTIFEVLEKITDDETTNCFILPSLNFCHHLNWLLSPAALALSFFHYQLLNLKKAYKDDNYFNKQSLPKVTYLSLTGLYSEADIDILHSFSDNIQSIFVYDERTGGPSFSNKKSEFSPDEDLRKSKRHFSTISNRLLLIPLKSSSNYSPYDILTIIESMVLRSIEKYKPSYIILNCSLIFEQNSSLFWLDEEIFGYITHLLSQVCDSKLIIFPFKLPNINSNPELRDTIKHEKSNLSAQQENRFNYIFDTYGVPYNEIYLRNCFINSIEVLTGIRDSSFWNREAINKKYKPNPFLNQTLYNIGRAYKDHPNLHYLHSKALGPLAKAAFLELRNKETFTSQDRLIDKIALFGPEDRVSQVKLEISSNEVVLDSNSQYFVDYSEEKPVVYIFNARQSTYDENSICRTYEPLSHFALTVDEDKLNKVYTVDSHTTYRVENASEILKDSSLCKCESLVFQVYGTLVDSNKDSTSIYYYDFKKKTQYKLKVRNSAKSEVMPRHSVTSCAFKKDNKYYLYVFGGKIQPNASFKEKSISRLDIIDIIEFYSTEDPFSCEWDYGLVKKESATKPVSFIPFTQSYAYYNEEKKRIFIMGGKVFQESVYDFTFPIFQFDVDLQKFDSFELYFNGSPEEQAEENNVRKKYIKPIAIADKNINVKIDEKQRDVSFLICPNEKVAILCAFDKKKDRCKYEEIRLIPEENNGDKATQSSSFSNPLAKKAPNSRFLSEVRYLFDTLEAKDVLLELIKWRLDKKEESTIKSDLIMKEFEDILIYKNVEDKNYYQKIKSFIKNKEFEEILQNKEYKLYFLKTYLEETWGLSLEQKQELSTSNSTSFISSSDKALDFVLKALELSSSGELDLTSNYQRYEAPVRTIIRQMDENFYISNLSTASTFKSHKTDEDEKMLFVSDYSKKSGNSTESLDWLIKSKESLEKIINGKMNQNESQKTLEMLKSLRSVRDSFNDSTLNKSGLNFTLDQSRADFQLNKYLEKDFLTQKVLTESIKDPILPQNANPIPVKQIQQPIEEEKIDHVNSFKKCLTTPNPHKLFFNRSRSEIIFPRFEDNQYSFCRLRFKIKKTENDLKDISFELSPSCVAIYQNVVICYIDEYFKVRYPEIFEDYKNWILYADLENSIKQVTEGKQYVVDLVFKKLFLVTHNHHIFNRCLFTNEDSLFLIGGKNYNFKGKGKTIYSTDICLFKLKKFLDIKQNSADFRDTETENMEIKGECVSVIHQDKVFVSKRISPTEIEILNIDGTRDSKVELDKKQKEKYEGYNVQMNMVNFRKKDEVLLILYAQDKNIDFLLFDPENESFEEKTVLLKSQEEDEEDKKFIFLYTGFEEFQINIRSQPLDQIAIYHFRGDKPKVLTCKIVLE